MARKKQLRSPGNFNLKEIDKLPGKIRYIAQDCDCGGRSSKGDVYFPVVIRSVDFDGCTIKVTVAPDGRELSEVDLGEFTVCFTELFDLDKIAKRREFLALKKRIEDKVYEVVPRGATYGRVYSGKFTYAKDRKAYFAAFMEDRKFVPEADYEALKEESNSFKAFNDSQMFHLVRKFVVRTLTDNAFPDWDKLEQAYENVCTTDD